jgi:hypothetical protein
MKTSDPLNAEENALGEHCITGMAEMRAGKTVAALRDLCSCTESDPEHPVPLGPGMAMNFFAANYTNRNSIHSKFAR